MNNSLKELKQNIANYFADPECLESSNDIPCDSCFLTNFYWENGKQVVHEYGYAGCFVKIVNLLESAGFSKNVIKEHLKIISEFNYGNISNICCRKVVLDNIAYYLKKILFKDLDLEIE